MQREKLFLSSLYLIASMFASLSAIALVPHFVSQAIRAAQIGAGLMLLFPVAGLTFLWRRQFQSVLQARRISFLIWGMLLALLGLANARLNKVEGFANSTLLVGVVLLFVGMILVRKEKQLKIQQATETEPS